MTLEEAQAQCVAQKLGPTACADLITPFCGGRGVIIEFQKPPRCVAGEGSAAKSAILLREAQERQAPRSAAPWLIGGAVLLGVVLYAATR